MSNPRGRDVLALDSAVIALAILSPRQAEIVELRFFGGFELAEIASLLGVAPSTVQREWRAARAWLEAEIRKGH